MTIVLQPTSIKDLTYVLDSEHSDENRQFILPWTKEKHEMALLDPDLSHLIVRDSEVEQNVGYVILAGLSNVHRSIEFRRIVITVKGQNYGRAVLKQIKRIAFIDLEAHRLWLDVKESNSRARYLYKSEGFVEEGILRECLKSDNGYESLVVMSMLHREYIETAIS